jgi:hypothetical protein
MTCHYILDPGPELTPVVFDASTHRRSVAAMTVRNEALAAFVTAREAATTHGEVKLYKVDGQSLMRWWPDVAKFHREDAQVILPKVKALL